MEGRDEEDLLFRESPGPFVVASVEMGQSPPHDGLAPQQSNSVWPVLTSFRTSHPAPQ